MRLTDGKAEAKGDRNTEFVVVALSAELHDRSGVDPDTAVSQCSRDDVSEPLRFKTRFSWFKISLVDD